MTQDPAGQDHPVVGSEEEVEVEDVVEVDVFGRAVVPESVETMEPEDLALALEAVCFALNRPVTQAEAAAVLGRSPQAVANAATALAVQLRGHGLMLQRHQDQLQIVTRPEVAWAVQRALNPERPTRLSRAAMETLAIIAYRQPVTRARLEAVRGVNCEAVLEHLEHRGLIAEVGRQPTPGTPRLFGTTLRFLQVVGLETIDALPPLPEGMEVPDLDDDRWRGSESSSGAGAAEPAAE
jgi:segregation and condensation protein B